MVLLRESRESPEVEVLMLRKNSRIAFGGMWVFPGGRIDAEDAADDGDPEGTARNAAARETREEAGIEAAPDDFVWFAHWTPPPSTPKRFATWFFAARAADHAVRIDGGEIKDHQWISPAAALERHAAGEIDLVPPTWVTLYHLSRYSTVDGILERFRSADATVYETHIGMRADGVRAAMWRGRRGLRDERRERRGSTPPPGDGGRRLRLPEHRDGVLRPHLWRPDSRAGAASSSAAAAASARPSRSNSHGRASTWSSWPAPRNRSPTPPAKSRQPPGGRSCP